MSTSLPGHMNELVRRSLPPPPPSSPPPPHAPPILSYPTLHFTSCIAVVASRGASSNHGPLQAFRFSSHTHTPTSGLHLATLVPLTLTRPPSRCTTRCDAWLTRAVADSSSLPTDLLACFNCDTLLPPFLRSRALRIPSSPSSDSGFAQLHVHKRLLVLHFASLHLATSTPSRAPLIDLVTATRSSFEHL